MERVSNLLQHSGLFHEEGRELLLQAWETAVARQLGDVGIDLDREAALLYYARHFDLDDAQLDHHGMLRQFVQGAAIAESAAGLVPQRMSFPQGAPAAALLRRSEQLVWLFARLYAKFIGSNGCDHVGKPPLVAGVGGFLTVHRKR